MRMAANWLISLSSATSTRRTPAPRAGDGCGGCGRRAARASGVDRAHELVVEPDGRSRLERTARSRRRLGLRAAPGGCCAGAGCARSSAASARPSRHRGRRRSARARTGARCSPRAAAARARRAAVSALCGIIPQLGGLALQRGAAGGVGVDDEHADPGQVAGGRRRLGRLPRRARRARTRTCCPRPACWSRRCRRPSARRAGAAMLRPSPVPP